MLSINQEDVIIKNLREILDTSTIKSAEVKLKNLGFCKEHTEDIMEIITSAVARSHFYQAGMIPKQFSGDFENDRIFNAILKILIEPKSNLKNRILKLLKLK